MDFQREQAVLDKAKWADSVREGRDQCGAYAYCSVCCKEEAQPCARAAYRYANGQIRVAKLIKRRKINNN